MPSIQSQFEERWENNWKEDSSWWDTEVMHSVEVNFREGQYAVDVYGREFTRVDDPKIARQTAKGIMYGIVVENTRQEGEFF